MLTGTVKFYNEAKGFGFIIDDETQNDVFVHATGLVDKVEQNDKVSFDVKEGKKGLNAINVKKEE
ncbi:cold-shock protein [Echinicola shivajiensis]|uniref:cold-shock protein n=2 Tax=Cyclobacteriaceae TaxID=563798 RepID=UPI001BFBFD6D|nr:cold shock domain-containing protein [Echinicola shivajiensis]